jgi:hypothetical protein
MRCSVKVGTKPAEAKMKVMFKRSLTIFYLLICLGVYGASYPVRIGSVNPRILVDQHNAPFLLVGDSPHSLLVNVSEADAAFYLADRGTNGFNSLWVELLCVPYTGGRADGSMLDGTLPFTATLSSGEFDLSTPNEAYFAHVDRIINMAATNGIQIMLDPLDTGGLTQTALDNGVTKCRAYGQYLGNRYKNFPNLIWLSGNDFQGWRTAANDAVITAVALGIRDNDTNHIQTVELDYYISSSLDDPNWKPIVGLNFAYTYYPTYVEVLHAYQQSTNMPVFMGEEHYEFETVGDPNSGQELGTPLVLRRQEYWTLLSGGAGQMYGNGNTWPFKSGWKNYLETTGARQLQYVTALFASRAWYNLIPDINHTVLTSGYGTYATSGAVSANNYVTAAKTADGTLALAYLPTIGTVTINLASMNGAVTARWYDPENGTYQSINGSPFPNTGTHNFMPPGNNSGGDGDWVLVLTASSVQKPTLTITTPTAGQRWSNVMFTVTGTVFDSLQVTNVLYQLNGLDWNPATTTNKWTNWTAQVNLTSGTNTIQAYAVDTGGNVSATNQVSFNFVTNQSPVATASANPTSGSVPLTVAFSSVGSSDPEGSALTYNWAFGDGVTSTATNPSHTYQSAGTYFAQLNVSDGANTATSSNISVTVTNVILPVVQGLQITNVLTD